MGCASGKQSKTQPNSQVRGGKNKPKIEKSRIIDKQEDCEIKSSSKVFSDPKNKPAQEVVIVSSALRKPTQKSAGFRTPANPPLSISEQPPANYTEALMQLKSPPGEPHTLRQEALKSPSNRRSLNSKTLQLPANLMDGWAPSGSKPSQIQAGQAKHLALSVGKSPSTPASDRLFGGMAPSLEKAFTTQNNKEVPKLALKSKPIMSTHHLPNGKDSSLHQASHSGQKEQASIEVKLNLKSTSAVNAVPVTKHSGRKLSLYSSSRSRVDLPQIGMEALRSSVPTPKLPFYGNHAPSHTKLAGPTTVRHQPVVIDQVHPLEFGSISPVASKIYPDASADAPKKPADTQKEMNKLFLNLSPVNKPRVGLKSPTDIHEKADLISLPKKRASLVGNTDLDTQHPSKASNGGETTSRVEIHPLAKAPLSGFHPLQPTSKHKNMMSMLHLRNTVTQPGTERGPVQSARKVKLPTGESAINLASQQPVAQPQTRKTVLSSNSSDESQAFDEIVDAQLNKRIQPVTQADHLPKGIEQQRRSLRGKELLSSIRHIEHQVVADKQKQLKGMGRQIESGTQQREQEQSVPNVWHAGGDPDDDSGNLSLALALEGKSLEDSRACLSFEGSVLSAQVR